MNRRPPAGRGGRAKTPRPASGGGLPPGAHVITTARTHRSESGTAAMADSPTAWRCFSQAGAERRRPRRAALDDQEGSVPLAPPFHPRLESSARARQPRLLIVSMKKGLVSSSVWWFCASGSLRGVGVWSSAHVSMASSSEDPRNWNVRSRAHVQKRDQAARRQAAPRGANS
jgi:hypothetical protein